MKRWPKKNRQQRQRDRDEAEKRLQAVVSGLSDEALELLGALLMLDAWDDPLYCPLVEKVEAELATASTVAVSDEPDRRARVRPRLPSRFTHNTSRIEKDQARRVLNNALGIEEPEPAPVRPRLGAPYLEPVRCRQKAARQARQEPADSYLHFVGGKPRPRLKTLQVDSPGPPQNQPAQVDTNPATNPWLYDESLWQ